MIVLQISQCEVEPTPFVYEEIFPTVQTVVENNQRTIMSPMVFPPCPRGPGRPAKARRQGRPWVSVAEKRKQTDCVDTIAPPKKRGQPPGSMNKNNVIVPLIE